MVFKYYCRFNGNQMKYLKLHLFFFNISSSLSRCLMEVKNLHETGGEKSDLIHSIVIKDQTEFTK